MANLLPSNATELERHAALALAQIERVPVPLRQLWNPDTCPAPLLPYLAWAFSVDRWASNWTEQAKRDAIKAAHFIHAHKGTIGALQRVVEPLGYLIEVVEWWQTSPPGEPGTFALAIGVQDSGITEQMHDELFQLINDAKPASRHLSGLQIVLDSPLRAYFGSALVEGDALDVYPWQSPDLDIAISSHRPVLDYSLDQMDVYLDD